MKELPHRLFSKFGLAKVCTMCQIERETLRVLRFFSSRQKMYSNANGGYLKNALEKKEGLPTQYVFLSQMSAVDFSFCLSSL